VWIEGAIATLTVLAPGLGSDAVEPVGDARGMDGSPSHVQAQQVQEPWIWVDHGVDPVLDAGDRVRVYYRTSDDAYVAIFQIDTDGTTRMLFPRSPTENHYARADRDYRLLFPRSAYWNVDDRPGIGYLFIVTSPTPFDLSDFRYSHYDGGWDLSAVGSTVYSDPYVAMDDYVARLVPDWEFVSYGLDFLQCGRHPRVSAVLVLSVPRLPPVRHMESLPVHVRGFQGRSLQRPIFLSLLPLPRESCRDGWPSQPDPPTFRVQGAGRGRPGYAGNGGAAEPKRRFPSRGRPAESWSAAWQRSGRVTTRRAT